MKTKRGNIEGVLPDRLFTAGTWLISFNQSYFSYFVLDSFNQDTLFEPVKHDMKVTESFSVSPTHG